MLLASILKAHGLAIGPVTELRRICRSSAMQDPVQRPRPGPSDRLIARHSSRPSFGDGRLPRGETDPMTGPPPPQAFHPSHTPGWRTRCHSSPRAQQAPSLLHASRGRAPDRPGAGPVADHWPPRVCPACVRRFDWWTAPPDGRLHGFSVQETGVPAGFARPLVFAMVDVGVSRAAPSSTSRIRPPSWWATASGSRGPGRRRSQGSPRLLPAFAGRDAG